MKSSHLLQPAHSWLPFFHPSGSSSPGSHASVSHWALVLTQASFPALSSMFPPWGSSFKTTASVFLLTSPAWISLGAPDLHSHWRHIHEKITQNKEDKSEVEPFTIQENGVDHMPIHRFRRTVLLFSHSVVSNSSRPQALQHTRLPCPSPVPRACSNSRPLSQ